MSLDTVSASTAPGGAEALLDERAALTVRQAQALQALMDLSDPDLLDLLLARREPEGELDLPDVRAVLNQMRAARALPLNS